MSPRPVIEPMHAPEGPSLGQYDASDPYAGRRPEPPVMAGVLVGGQVTQRLCCVTRARSESAN